MNNAYPLADGSRQVYHEISSSLPRVDVPRPRYSVSEGIPLLRVRLLGGFCVQRTEVGQVVSEWQRRSAKTLIKILAVLPGHAVHREQITDILWPGVDNESALNS